MCDRPVIDNCLFPLPLSRHFYLFLSLNSRALSCPRGSGSRESCPCRDRQSEKRKQWRQSNSFSFRWCVLWLGGREAIRMPVAHDAFLYDAFRRGILGTRVSKRFRDLLARSPQLKSGLLPQQIRPGSRIDIERYLPICFSCFLPSISYLKGIMQGEIIPNLGINIRHRWFWH